MAANPVDPPIFRRTDPSSSKAAAKVLVKSGVHASQLMKVMSYLYFHQGHTSKELSVKMERDGIVGEDMRFLVARRLPELAEAGLAERRGKRSCKISGRLAVTWYVRDDISWAEAMMKAHSVGRRRQRREGADA